MFTMIPMFIILGYIGWKRMEQGAWWQNKQGFIRGSWKWFWGLNCLVLLLATPQSSKFARIDVMSYLRTKSDLNSYVIEASHHGGGMLLPRYYLGRYATYHHITGKKPFQMTADRIANYPPEKRPEYIIFSQRPNEDLSERIAFIEEQWPKLTHDTTIVGSMVDQIHNKLNPAYSRNENMAVYRINW